MSTITKGMAIGPPRFAIAIHALVWLTQSGGVLSSSIIASQVNSHATFLRRVLQSLAQAGLVEAREGREGGYMLGKASCEISLADVYIAVKAECTGAVVEVDCGETGKQLDKVLEKLLADAEQHTIAYLRQFSIADVMARVDFFADNRVDS
ncbi:Rrf2 family transcriptional regulator [Paenibacillus sp. SYP-B3998]|uniref:Rrf2 family transcriptional regulator n=1 Tax=Paenibacillus sp. SYP-B3998 TaxID=2678564 RepID=A0A6G3ZXB5_9BACL|nr:Rrf2 family transcriptional regulator [Paenibacillus sp. SYP-B3998]NEW06688.1 Rrf2 family transcriptional regulator [Paenibacillus sp. SYP-B3998]